MKHRALQLVHQSIVRLWVHPLESKTIPRLESAKQTKLNSALLRWFSWWANVGRILVLDLRVNVVRLAGTEWNVTYFGTGESLEAISSMLFPEMPGVDKLPRVFLWRVPALVQKYTSEGDLVVCELNQILDWSFNGLQIFFTVPLFIKQVFEGIDQPLDNILVPMNQTIRRNIRKLENQGFSYSITRDVDDFDFFYYRMYLPYITSRHEGQGMILDNYESTRNEFKKGELFQVMDGKDPVCGMICELHGELCVAKEMGVLDANFELVKSGVNVALWWFMLLWARDQGAKNFDFGSSRAVISNGVFNFKRQWGTRVILHKGIHSHWSFYAQQLPENLREHLNELGFITSLDGKCYKLILNGYNHAYSPIDISREAAYAAKCGLDGLAIYANKDSVRITS